MSGSLDVPLLVSLIRGPPVLLPCGRLAARSLDMSSTLGYMELCSSPMLRGEVDVIHTRRLRLRAHTQAMGLEASLRLEIVVFDLEISLPYSVAPCGRVSDALVVL